MTSSNDKFAIAGAVAGVSMWLIGVLIGLALFIGYVLNVIGLFGCDFEAPYKAEAIRGVGIVIPFVGGVAGYLELEDGVVAGDAVAPQMPRCPAGNKEECPLEN